MKRYNAVQGGVYDNSVMVEEDDGDYVWYEDVEHLEDINAEMLKLLEQWHSIAEEYTSYALVGETRAAIAKAKGETL